MGIVMGILNWASGGVLDKLLNFFAQRETERLESMNEARKQEYADQRDQRMRANEIRLATAGFWEMRLLTAWVLFIFVFHLTSIWLDTQFAFGWAIAKFPSPIDEYEWQIILSLFGLGVANRALTTVAAVFRK